MVGSLESSSAMDPCGDGAGEGVDLLSGLPDDLLLHILARLRCVRAAVRTGALSRRWLGLWRRLPELYFRNIVPPALEATLAQVALPKLSFLHVDISFYYARPSAAVVASLLRAAARLDPVDFSLRASMDGDAPNTAIEMPRFVRATSIEMDVVNLSLTPPPPGVEFPVLERLSIARSDFEANALVSRCPRLRALEMRQCFSHETIMLRSATIEELDVHGGWGREFIRIIDINAPALKKFTFNAYLDPDFSMSLLAPMVENHWWNENDISQATAGRDLSRAVVAMLRFPPTPYGMTVCAVLLRMDRPVGPASWVFRPAEASGHS
ncbi:hypothetical protein ACP4OV_028448 [Aristida adscensionis]